MGSLLPSASECHYLLYKHNNRPMQAMGEAGSIAHWCISLSRSRKIIAESTAVMTFFVFYLNSHAHRGKQSFDQAGVGATVPAEVKKEDDEFDLYRKRMMLAYRFRPNPLVSQNRFQSDFVIN